MSLNHLIEEFKQKFDNSNNISETLRQGVSFNNYQNKIKTGIKKTSITSLIEGFSSNDYNEGIMQTQQASQALKEQSAQFAQQTTNDKAELADLEAQFATLMLQYEQAQANITATSSDYVSQSNISNPYKNKNVELANGKVGYVTNKGEYKWYSSPELLNSTAGKNGCPTISETLKVNTASLNYDNPGSFIPTKPPLLVGSAMIAQQACGNEGTNVFVNSMINNPTTKYEGCYKDDPIRAMGEPLSNGTNTYNYNSCQDAAITSGNRYFAVQNFQQDTQLGQCVLTNSLEMAEQYGKSNNLELIELWRSSNTVTGFSAQVTNEGKLLILASDGTQAYLSDSARTECINGGNIDSSSINATYGANCNGQNDGTNFWTVPIGNMNDTLKQLLEKNTDKSYLSYTIGTDVTGQWITDPAPGCQKQFNMSYKCGNLDKNINLPNSQTPSNETGGEGIILDCVNESKGCNFFLILGDNGNLCIYKGTPTSYNIAKDFSWCAGTYGKQQEPNLDWISSASGSKYPGQNYIQMGQQLAEGEWIGSTNGTLKLIMENGYLVLYTSKHGKTACNLGKDGKMYGDPWTNPIYGIDQSGLQGNIGKLGFIDADSNMKEYPSTMIGLADTYQMFPNYNSPGNDLAGMPMANSTLQTCKTACTQNIDCHGLIFDQISGNCWLKDANVYPKALKNPEQNLLLLVRNPAIISDESCDKEINNIDSVQWSKYNNKGEQMTPETKCGLATLLNDSKQNLSSLQVQLADVAEKITVKLSALQNENNNINNKMNVDQGKIKTDLDTYNKINVQLKNFKADSLQNINGMLSDTDLIVLKENYQYIFWSILAIGLVIITMNNIRYK